MQIVPIEPANSMSGSNTGEEFGKSLKANQIMMGKLQFGITEVSQGLEQTCSMPTERSGVKSSRRNQKKNRISLLRE